MKENDVQHISGAASAAADVCDGLQTGAHNPTQIYMHAGKVKSRRDMNKTE